MVSIQHRRGKNWELPRGFRGNLVLSFTCLGGVLLLLLNYSSNYCIPTGSIGTMNLAVDDDKKNLRASSPASTDKANHEQVSLEGTLITATLGNALLKPHMKDCMKYSVKPPPTIDYEGNLTMNNILQQLRKVGLRRIIEDKQYMTILEKTTTLERERLSYDSDVPVIYLAHEVHQNLLAEEQAVINAAPLQDLSQLNGLNVGAGGRHIPGTLPVDAHRSISGFNLPQNQQNVAGTFLGWADELPFAPNSLDFIVSLHNLEHLANPPETILHYLQILKPGGGIGIVIPNMDYAWHAHTQDEAWGHRWATRPELVCAMYQEFWKDKAELVQLATLERRLSFDFVLRKHGNFVPFNSSSPPKDDTGKKLYEKNNFWGDP